MMTTNDDSKLRNAETAAGGGSIDKDGDKTVTIEVNGHKIKMLEGPATGQEIKDAAIKEGIEIEPNFVLQLELPNGSNKVIGDDDKVSLHKNMSFTAIAPDDNS
ncbi:MAG: multiubiquitin domain-containing protein [Gammaproteobacteria bacterium]|nr:multiubiquitin domain-containing protein [Gammaproteobacteria bacterium]